MKLGRTTRISLSVVALFVAHLAVCSIDRSTAAPGTEGHSFDGFIQLKKSPQKMELIEQDNQQYVFVTGAWTPLWRVTYPSGPPCYVFNSNGTLVDWTSDVGDDSQFVRKWPFTLKREEISMDRAHELFQKQLSVRTL